MYRKNSKKPLVSIIVPVYNTEKYLKQCLNSLRVQTLKDIEIIVIDDGSADSSGYICDSFAAIDSRFRVFHKKNEGLAAARNYGLGLAQSDFIMFLDSDDWVEPDFCEKPYRKAMESGAELVVFRYAETDGEEINTSYSFQFKGLMSREEALTNIWTQTRAYAWNKLYHQKLFEGIQYPVGRLFEDDAITHRIVHNAVKIYYLDKCLYHYRNRRHGSISNKKSYKTMDDYYYCNFLRIDDLKRWGYDYKGDEAKLAVSYLAVFGRNGELSDHCIRIIKEYKGFDEDSFSWRRKTMYKVYRFSPFLFDLISIISGKRIGKDKQSKSKERFNKG